MKCIKQDCNNQAVWLSNYCISHQPMDEDFMDVGYSQGGIVKNLKIVGLFSVSLFWFGLVCYIIDPLLLSIAGIAAACILSIMGISYSIQVAIEGSECECGNKCRCTFFYRREN